MSHKNRNGPANLEFFEQVLEGFSGQYDIALEVFGNHRLHWRLTGICATLDVWPTTGRYWIKDLSLGCKEWRKGILPHDYTKVVDFLYRLFDIPKDQMM